MTTTYYPTIPLTTVTWSDEHTSVIGPTCSPRLVAMIEAALDSDRGLTVSFGATKEKVDTLWDQVEKMLEASLTGDAPEISHQLDYDIERQLDWCTDLYVEATTGKTAMGTEVTMTEAEVAMTLGSVHRGLLRIKADVLAERKES